MSNTSLLTPFVAYADPSLIRSASSFFDNSTTSILRELLQNSRRSGATRVDLHRRGNRFVYTDNGPGCAPQDLLGLGASRWEAGVLERESPAGCGFFALARRNPTVTCPRLNWRVDLTEEHFNGEREIRPVPAFGEAEFVEADASLGLSIAFDRDPSRYDYGADLIAKFMPIDFYLDGKLTACRGDFFALPNGCLASKVIEFNEHITVQVALILGGSSSPTACYHGWQVDLPEQDYTTIGTTRGIVAVRARIMVTQERALPLELPQRNKMIKSETTAALKDLILCTGLELAAATLQDTSLASPQIWLNARGRGYTGPVLHPKFIGQLITRAAEMEMAEYALTPDDDGDCVDVGEHITFEEFESGDYKFAPTDEELMLIAQTTIPSVVLKNGAGSIYDIDLEQYFAPGLRLVKPLKSLEGFGHGIGEGHESYEWAQRWRALVKRGNAWSANAMVVATGTTDEGKEFCYEGDASGWQGFDEDNLYDTINLEFSSDDDEEPCISLPTAALFRITGDRESDDVSFILTKKWFEGMPSRFPDELASVVFAKRKCREYEGDDDSVTHTKIVDKLKQKFATFEGLEDFYKERFLSAAAEAVSEGLYHLDPKPGCIVLTLPVTPGRSYLSADDATCEFIPPFQTCYTIEGEHGMLECDVHGERSRSKSPEGQPIYPEFHTFDVATMQQLGIAPGLVDVLDACGWHDSTKKIYVTPSLPHVLWKTGFLSEPTFELESPEVRAALVTAVVEGKVSVTLFSALLAEYESLITSIANVNPPVQMRALLADAYKVAVYSQFV